MDDIDEEYAGRHAQAVELDEDIIGSYFNLEAMLMPTPHTSGGQGFGLHDDSSKRMPPVHPSSLSCAEDGPKQHLAMILNSISHRWNPFPTDTRCQFNDADFRFQQLSSSVHKAKLKRILMVLGLVRTDVNSIEQGHEGGVASCKSCKTGVVDHNSNCSSFT